MIFKLAGRERFVKPFAASWSTGDSRFLAAQGGAAALTERGDATFEVSRFSSADRE